MSVKHELLPPHILSVYWCKSTDRKLDIVDYNFFWEK